MKKCTEKEFYDFIHTLEGKYEMKETHLIRPVTLSFFQGNERVAAIIAEDEENIKCLIEERG